MHLDLKFWKNRRYVVTALAFFGFFNVYALRANLSIAIVAMTQNRTSTENGATINKGPEFDWDPELRGYVLSSFFYGYITTQLLGGWISAKIGGKRVFGVGIAVTAVLTLLTPVAANISVYLLLAVRILEGVFEGVTYPCIHAIWSRWAPPLERTKLATIAFSGSYVGTVISMPASAYLADAFGWSTIFYVFGVIAVVWYFNWEIFITESPADDRRISKEELEYIQNSLGNVESIRRSIKHPWKKILRSGPVWAIVFSHFTDNWGFYTLLTELPTFIKDTFGYDLGKTGFLSGLPYLGMGIMIQFSGWLADRLRKKKVLTTTQVRKIFNCVAFIIHAAFMLGVAFCSSPVGIIICLIFAVGLGVFAWSGFGVNHLDIAPKHASVIMGLSNTFATLAGIFSPIVTGRIVTTHSKEEWRIVFCIASGVFVLGSIVYGLFADGEVQDWAVEEELGNESPQPIDTYRKTVEFQDCTYVDV